MRDIGDGDQAYEQRREEEDAGERPRLYTGVSIHDFVAASHRLNASGVSAGEEMGRLSALMGMPKPTRIEWDRRCEASLARSRARRTSPHPWPHGADWRVVLVLFVLTMAALAAGWLLTLNHLV
jgi:hypothetical protein